MRKKFKCFLLLFSFVFVAQHVDVIPTTMPIRMPCTIAQNPDQPARQFTRTHVTRVDLWVRAGVPRYSFRTGRWILGEPIGVLKAGTEIREINREFMGFTQVWLEVFYKLPDGSIQGGPGHWIWAGRKDTEQNVTQLSASAPSESSLHRTSLSLLKEAWAQGDTIPGRQEFIEIPGNYLQKDTPFAENEEIIQQLDSMKVDLFKFIGYYVALLFGMIIGAVWEWVTSASPSKQKPNSNGNYKSLLRVVIGSFISFSFFILPIMGFAEIAFTFSSAILAFHFGIVHSDPTDLVLSLKRKYLARV